MLQAEQPRLVCCAVSQAAYRSSEVIMRLAAGLIYGLCTIMARSQGDPRPTTPYT